jgi:hypothetical protein
MSDTLNIVAPIDAPGSISIVYSLSGVAPNLSSGYTASMKFWPNGAPTDGAAQVTATQGTGITLGAAGAISVNLATIGAVLNILGATESAWHYTLSVTPTAGAAARVCSGAYTRTQP